MAERERLYYMRIKICHYKLCKLCYIVYVTYCDCCYGVFKFDCTYLDKIELWYSDFLKANDKNHKRILIRGRLLIVFNWMIRDSWFRVATLNGLLNS